MDEDEGERLWIRVGNEAVIMGDGDNVALRNIQRPEIPFIAETGGGDMTDHNNRIAWIARTRRSNLRFRLMLLATVGLGFSFCLAVLSSLALRHCFIKASYRMEIHEAIDKGYISSRYIHMMNEALYLIRHKRESELLRKISQLNEAYSELLERIHQVMKTITVKDEDGGTIEDI